MTDVQGQNDQSEMKNHLPGGTKTKKNDIVKQIKDLYMRKRAPEVEKNVLIPTKATLFGLDVRFRSVEQKMLEDKLRRTAFKRPKTREFGGPVNRHEPPLERRLVSSQARRDPTLKAMVKSSQCIEEREDGIDYIKFS